LKGLNGRLSRASDAYLSKDFSLKEYSEEKKNILPRISELETEIDRLRNLNMSPQNDLIPDFIDIVKRIHEGYGVGECKNIQLLLRKIIQRIDFKRKPFGIKITFMAN
jgi:hypothetical protein